MCTWREVYGGFGDFQLKAGDDILVFGAGPVGLSFVKLGQAARAGVYRRGGPARKRSGAGPSKWERTRRSNRAAGWRNGRRGSRSTR